MTRAPAAVILVAILSAALTASQTQLPAAGIDLVEIDATVVDGKGRPIKGLQQTDFSVRDDNKPVAITTFSEVTGPVRGDPDSGRTIVLLLDDTGVLAVGTQTIQNIARAIVLSAADVDDVSVVRLHVRTDEPFGDRLESESRILAYRGGAWPFVSWSTVKEVLDKVASISELVAANTSKRKSIVCLGSSFICNIREPDPSVPRVFEAAWANALTGAARANVAVYALIPGWTSVRSGGLAEFTGGEVLASAYDMGPAVDRIFQDAGNYYVLGYWPTTTLRGPHRVEVKVNKRGAKVRARRLR